MRRIHTTILLLALAAPGAHGQLRSVAKNTDTARAVVVTVTPRGLSPRTIEITEGPFALRILNRSLAQTMTLSLAKEKGGNALLSKQHTPKQLNLREVIDLQPGTYHLTVVEMPKWDMTIVVNAKK